MSPEISPLGGHPGRGLRRGRFCLPLLGISLSLAALSACGGKGEVTQTLQAGAPVFTSTLSDATVLVGGKATFTASASGSPSYTWTRNGVAIPGATSNTYTTAEAVAEDNNAVIGLTAQTGVGKVSSYATLHVNYASITNHPADQTVTPGQAVTLSVTAAGSGTLAYQWVKDGVDIPGATASNLTVASVTLSDSAAYSCKVTSSLNGTLASATSRAGRLAVVTDLPVITAQPADLTVKAGDPAAFSVVATNALGYQWYKDGYPLQGATGSTCTLPMAIAGDDNATLSVAVINPRGQVMSAPAKLRVNYLRVSQQPAGSVVAEGQSLTLSTAIALSGTPSYQWYRDGIAIDGATGPNCPLGAVSPSQAGYYTCAYTSVLGITTVSGTSEPAQIQVVGLPVITSQISGAGNKVVGTPVSLTISAQQVGTGLMSYQWYKDGVAMKDVAAKAADPAKGTPAVTAVTGTKTPSLYIQSLLATDTGVYTCTITNTWRGVPAAVTTQAAAMTVTGYPVVMVDPADVTVLKGRPATFTIKADGVAPMTYQWYRNGQAIIGATDTTYTLSSTAVADSGAHFHCVATNAYGTAQSRAALLTVNALPAVTEFKASTQRITLGQGVVFTYTFDENATATFGPKDGNAAVVTNGGSTTVFPEASGTYTLTVTLNGTPTATDLPVTVKAYTPSNLYVLNSGTDKTKAGSITRFPVHLDAKFTKSSLGNFYDPSTTLGLLGEQTGSPAGTGLNPMHASTTWDEKFLFVVNAGDSTVGTYTVDATTQDPLLASSFALPMGYTSPWCAAPTPDGKFLFVACKDGIAVLGIDPATGALSDTGHGISIVGRLQGDLLVHPSGKWLYVACSGDGNQYATVVKAYTIDSVTGALALNGSDMAVTYASGKNPFFNQQIQNGRSLAFDRAANLLFTVSYDPLMWAHPGDYTDMDGAIDSYQVDPYTGTLKHLATAQSAQYPNENYFLVNGTRDAFHGLSYSATPGVDHLMHGYINDWDNQWGDVLGDYQVNPADGTISGYTNNPNWGLSPWRNIERFSYGGASALVQDRSGRILVQPQGQDTNSDIMVWGIDAQGNIALMGNPTNGAFPRRGNVPSHGIFLGTLN